MNSTKGAPEYPARPAFLSWHLFVLFAAGAIALFARFFKLDTFGYFEDDFFYYVVAAQNFIQHGISTFDGTHLTNGYHPLWFLILAGLMLITSGTAFFVAVQAVSLAAILAFYAALVSLNRSLGLNLQWSRLAALVLSLHALLLFRYGMEITASLPLGIATVAWIARPQFRWTTPQTLIYGLLACATVLARLDSLLLIALLLVAQTLATGAPWTARLRRLSLVALGFLPLAAYVASNIIIFGTLLPVSGMAKQMKPLWPPSLNPAGGLLPPYSRMQIAFVLPALALLAAGLIAFALRSRQTRHRPLLAALLLFPFVQVGVLCMLSDWGSWPWYDYPLIYSSIAAMALLLGPVQQTRRLNAAALALAAAFSLFFFVYISVYAVSRPPSSIAMLAKPLAVWMRQHPGSYAMGDEAGTTAYLSQQPIVQTEGLMMDRAYLTQIRASRPLAEVLRQLNVRFYVVLYAKADATGCYPIAEPSNAGSRSPHMRAEGCDPLFTAGNPDGTVRVFAVDHMR